MNRTDVPVRLGTPMVIDGVRAPINLLLSRAATASAKLVWLAIRMDRKLPEPVPFSVSRIANRTCLSRPTVRRAIAKLGALGWYRPPSANRLPLSLPAGPDVVIPEDLINTPDISAQAKIVYGVLQDRQRYKDGEGILSYQELAAKMSLNVKTVRRAVRELVQNDWVKVAKRGKHQYIPFQLWDPIKAQVLQVQKRLDDKTQSCGETIMKAYCSLLVDSKAYVDNAKCGFNVNPDTGELLEFDRFYYQHNVAIEFNGPQHDHPTERYSAAEVAKQRRRDRIKQQICAQVGVTLLVLQAEDLSLLTMRQKLGAVLPLGDLRGKGCLTNYLEVQSRSYRSYARDVWARKDAWASCI